MNLLVALRAIRVEGSPLCRNLPKMHVISAVMPRVAPQAEERRRLLQQVIDHRTMWIVADHAILRHRRMLMHEGALLRRVTFIAGQVGGGLLQEFSALPPVGVMALGAKHFPFRHWVMERQAEHGSDLRVTTVADQRLIDRHWQPFRAIDTGMIDVDELRHLGARVRIVAIGTSHVMQRMRARFPGHGGVGLVASEALVRARFLADMIMRIVAGNALETIHAIDLVRMGDPLELRLLGMAFIAGARLRGSQHRHGRMGIMTINAGHAGLGMGRPMPRGGLRVLLVALNTHVRACFLAKVAVRVMTGCAMEFVGAINLVGMSRQQHVADLRGRCGGTWVVLVALVARLRIRSTKGCVGGANGFDLGLRFLGSGG